MIITSIKIYNRRGQHRIHGLVGFEISCANTVSADEEPTLLVGIGGLERLFKRSDLTDNRVGTNRPSNVLVLHLNSLLIENGAQTLEIFSLTGSGTASKARIAAYDVLVDNSGDVSTKSKASLVAARAQALLPALIDSSHFGDHEQGSSRPWFEYSESSIAFETDSKQRRGSNKRKAPKPSVVYPMQPAADQDKAAEMLKEYGYCILPELIPSSLCDELISQARSFVEAEGKSQGYEWGSSQRVMNTHNLPAGQTIWLYPAVISFLRKWFRDEPAACQTLFYFFGSQQRAHQDTIHLTAYPAGYMCGVWIALEDVKEGAGELFVYPKSHTLPRLRGAELGLAKVAADYSEFERFDSQIDLLTRTNGLERVPYYAKKGTILVWHENLIHGGAPRLDSSMTRCSIVSHYFARGAVAYYDARGEAASLIEATSPAG